MLEASLMDSKNSFYFFKSCILPGIWNHCKSSELAILCFNTKLQDRRIKYLHKKKKKRRNLKYKHIITTFNVLLMNQYKIKSLGVIGAPARYFLCFLTSVQQGSPADPWNGERVSMLCCVSHCFLHGNGSLDVELVQMFTFKQKTIVLPFCHGMN